MRAVAHTAKLREDEREERARLAAEKKLSFNQKVRGGSVCVCVRGGGQFWGWQLRAGSET
jgi:hypothetical protein